MANAMKLEAVPSLGPSGEYEFDNINLADLLAFDSPSEGLDALALPSTPDDVVGTSAFQPSHTTSRPAPSCTFGGEEEALASNFDTTEDAQQQENGTTHSSKRRRRVRNAKQQELNRLAQQRYRQRKKQVFSSLQTTVTGLSEQLGGLSVLERENIGLKQEKEQLTQQLAAKDAALLSTQQQLAAQSQQLSAQGAHIAQQERKIFEQQVVIETQAQQLKQAGLPVTAQEPILMSERILQVVKSALADAAAQQGVPLTISAELLVQHLSRSLSSCCRELYYPGKAPAAAEAPAITVSCC